MCVMTASSCRLSAVSCLLLARFVITFSRGQARRARRVWSQDARLKCHCRFCLLDLEFRQQELGIHLLHHVAEIGRILQHLIVDCKCFCISNLYDIDIADQSILHLLQLPYCLIGCEWILWSSQIAVRLIALRRETLTWASTAWLLEEQLVVLQFLVSFTFSWLASNFSWKGGCEDSVPILSILAMHSLHEIHKIRINYGQNYAFLITQ